MRVFQDFATLDLLSGGRAEIMAGRGSFIESFPLFGYDLNDYDELFDEKLELLLRSASPSGSTWSGEHRSAIEDRGVYPRPVQDPLPVWVAVGGDARVGDPRRHARAADGARDHRRHARALHAVRGAAPRGGAAGRARAAPALSINSHGYIADTSQQALDESFPYAAAMMNAIGRERGWPPMTRADYEAAATLRGANFVGSPQQVVEKILFQHELFGHDRFLVQFSVGTLPHDRDAALDRAARHRGRARRARGARAPRERRPEEASRRGRRRARRA